MEAGRITRDGDFPSIPSGGLIGLGPSGGRHRAWCWTAPARSAAGRRYQPPKAENMLTFNVGGSTTTCASFVVGVG